MSPKIPNLAETKCVFLRLCSELGAEEPISPAAKVEEHLTDVRVGEHQVYIRYWLGAESGKHLHIDIAAHEYFSEPPESDTAFERFVETFNRFEGMSYAGLVTGVFEIPEQELPPASLISAMGLEREVAGIKLKLAGAKLALTGAPVETLSWDTRPNGRVRVLIESAREGEISESYFAEALAVVAKAFNMFILRQ